MLLEKNSVWANQDVFVIRSDKETMKNLYMSFVVIRTFEL